MVALLLPLLGVTVSQLGAQLIVQALQLLLNKKVENPAAGPTVVEEGVSVKASPDSGVPAFGGADAAPLFCGISWEKTEV
jgi:hypothetical protein